VGSKWTGGIISGTAPLLNTISKNGIVLSEIDTKTTSGIWSIDKNFYNPKWPQAPRVGTLWTWGFNNYGQIGDLTAASKSSPTQIGSSIPYSTTPPSSVGWSSISAHNYTASILAIKTDGTLWGWGSNSYGVLADNTIVAKSSPIQIGTDTNWSMVSNGQVTIAALKTNGTLWAWGRNVYGALGQNDTVYRSSPTQVGTLTTWTSVAASTFMVAGIKSGELWVCGVASSGNLGQNNIINRSSPVQVGTATNWSSVSISYYQTVTAIKTNGELWMWGGTSNYGIFADNTSGLYRSSPTQVAPGTTWSTAIVGMTTALAIKTNGTLWTWGGSSLRGDGGALLGNASSPVQIGVLTNWLKVSATYDATALALKTDGSLWAWGRSGGGNYGELGQNNTRESQTPVRIGSLNNWLNIAAGNYYSTAINTSGTLFLWGNNSNNNILLQLDNQSRSSPVQIDNRPLNWSIVKHGSGFGAGIKNNGTLWVWGANSFGQLGLNISTITYRSSPVQLGSSNIWKNIFPGLYSTHAIDNNSQLWGWGGNSSGQLGDNTTVNKSSPVQIGSPYYDWSMITSSYDTTLGITKKGNLYWWGTNAYGLFAGTQFGPINNIYTDSTWLNVSGDGTYVLAIKTDNTLWAWGQNSNGQLGLNNTSVTSVNSPTQVGLLNNWLYVSKSSGNNIRSFAIKTDGTLWAWGANNSGALGIGLGTLVYRSSPIQIGALTNWSTIIDGGNTPRITALKTDGTLWSWGGTIPDNFGNNTSSPVQIGTSTNWSKISGGTNFVAAIKTDGTIWAWGANLYGQHGDNRTQTGSGKSSPAQIGSLTNWLAISAGYYHAVALKTNGTLWTWGRNNFGQLGDNTLISRSSPVQVGTLTNWTSLPTIVSNYTSFAFNNAGLFAWGSNSSGQLGNNQTSRSSPTQVSSNTYFVDIAINNSAIGLKNDGTLWGWGGNGSGVLGQQVSTPIQIGVLTNWTSINSAGDSFYATKNNGTLWSWGQNDVGQLGVGDVVTKTPYSQVGLDTSWLSISTSYRYVLATKTDGTLWGWGLNDSGQLAQNDLINRSSPVQIGALTNWISVNASASSVRATKSDGTLWGWGGNSNGQLGDTTVVPKSSPIQIGTRNDWLSLTSNVSDSNIQAASIALTAINPPSVWVQPTVGQVDTTFTRSLYSWGYGTTGQLGDSTIANRSSPVLVADSTWTSLSGLVHSSADHSGLVKIDGTLWTWGSGGYGQLGNNTIIDRSSPVQVGAVTTWNRLSIGFRTGLAVNEAGTLWSWGDNSFGQLGKQDTILRSSPIQVGSDTNWSTQLAAGYLVSFAIKTNGTLWGWGYNNYGQIGDTTLISRSSPVQVGAATTINASSEISNNANTMAAIKGDGTLWTWGRNQTGSLGGSTVLTGHRSSPVQVGTLTNWKSIAIDSAGGVVALKTDGSIWTWGYNGYGALGNSTVVPRSSPVQLGTLRDWASITCGFGNVGAIKIDGTLWTWGYNQSGSDGLGDLVYRSSPVQTGIGKTWSKIHKGRAATFAIDTAGALWVCGSNSTGKLGLNNITANFTTFQQVGTLTNWSSISSDDHSTIAVKTDGTLWAIGANSAGQLGQNNVISYSSPVQVSAGTTWRSAVYGGASSVLAIKSDGTLWGWGSNITYGVLGDNTVINKSTPVQISSDTTWLKVVLADTFNTPSALATKTTGSIWVWGTNAQGQLGDQTITLVTNRSSPGQIGALTNWIVAGTTISEVTNWSWISTGTGHTMAIRTGGTLWSWGLNSSGQLGLNDILYRYSPTQVGGLTDWSSVYAGGNYSLAKKIDGTLWAWGISSSGQLGDNTTANKSSPVQIGALSDWSTISTGNYISLATKTSGTLWGWGANIEGALGQGDTTNRSSPTQIGTTTGWTGVGVHGLTAFAIKTVPIRNI
jgi:alpha-tubulin suppressor-like RCC1 family protein